MFIVWVLIPSEAGSGISCGFIRSDLHCASTLQTAAKEEQGGHRKKKKQNRERITANSLVLYSSQANVARILPTSPDQYCQ